MNITQSTAGKELTLALGGRFDESTRQDFRSATDRALLVQNVDFINVDLDSVNYLDSSALGMLLVLREKASAANTNVVLSGAKGAVKATLDVANFHKLFQVS